MSEKDNLDEFEAQDEETIRFFEQATAIKTAPKSIPYARRATVKNSANVAMGHAAGKQRRREVIAENIKNELEAEKEKHKHDDHEDHGLSLIHISEPTRPY